MTNEEIETEMRHLATKDDVSQLEVRIEKEFGDFRSDLVKTVWITQLSTIGLVLVGIGIMNTVLYFVLTNTVTSAIAKIH